MASNRGSILSPFYFLYIRLTSETNRSYQSTNRSFISRTFANSIWFRRAKLSPIISFALSVLLSTCSCRKLCTMSLNVCGKQQITVYIALYQSLVLFQSIFCPIVMSSISLRKDWSSWVTSASGFWCSRTTCANASMNSTHFSSTSDVNETSDAWLIVSGSLPTRLALSPWISFRMRIKSCGSRSLLVGSSEIRLLLFFTYTPITSMLYWWRAARTSFTSADRSSSFSSSSTSSTITWEGRKRTRL
uniref:Uncharacterized protein n=1 Tax=Anopheles melas TaxID=34690 RepID=A0A182U8E5_9DIPT